MKVLFFGSSEFSIPSLKTLINSRHQPVAIITTPAKPKGRGLKLEPNPVEKLAVERQIPCFAPAKLKDPEVLAKALSLAPDVLAVASYGKILPAEWLSLAKRLPLNVHPSILPKYRGAAPINWQIINGESETGVTIFKMEAGLDCGDILAQDIFPLDGDENARALSQRLSEAGASALLRVIDQIESGQFRMVPQDHDQATFAPKLKKEDGALDWNLPALTLHNKIRGLAPWPGAYFHFNGELLKILKSRLGMTNGTGTPGEIVEINKAGFMKIMTGGGALLLDRVQPAGKREMTAHEFAIGHRLSPGQKL